MGSWTRGDIQGEILADSSRSGTSSGEGGTTSLSSGASRRTWEDMAAGDEERDPFNDMSGVCGEVDGSVADSEPSSKRDSEGERVGERDCDLDVFDQIFGSGASGTYGILSPLD